MDPNSKKKNIILANDDGIDAPGIRMLGKALMEVANVYVCAPDTQRSAASHSITMTRPIGIHEEENDFSTRAFRMTGTPVDCVKIGWGYLKEHEGIDIDYVFSGINLGSNLGTDAIYSGTVGAAIEGFINGLSGVAVSIASYHPQFYEYPCELAVELFYELEARPGQLVMYNLNVPDKPKSEIKGVRITRLGYKGYDDQLQEEDSEDGYARYYFYGAPTQYSSNNLNIDVIAHQRGYATITPLHCDLTAHEQIAGLKHLER